MMTPRTMKRNFMILLNLKTLTVGIKFIIILCIVLLSCSNKRAIKLIAGQKEKYWYVIRQNQISYSNPSYVYLFKKNGTCKYYFITKNQEGQTEKELFNYGDVLVSN